MDREAILRELRRQGRRRQRALAEDEDARKQIAALAKAGRAIGMPKTHIADAADISRPSLDDMLRR